jgi:hypothetical protein
MSFQPGPNEPMSYGGQRSRFPGGWSPGRFSPAILAVAVVVIVILVGAAVISRRNASPSPTPTASPVGQPITAPSSSAVASSVSVAPSAAAGTAAPSSARASSSAAAASSKPKVYLVGNTDGDGVYLRKTPSLNDRLTAYVDGTELVAIGEDVTAEGELWHHVRAPDGQDGYVPAKYTIPAPE